MPSPTDSPLKPASSAVTSAPVTVPGRGYASDYAADLLASLDWQVEREPTLGTDPTPAQAWADSGAMALSGHGNGEALAAPGPVASCADGAARALSALARATREEGTREEATRDEPSPAVDLAGSALLGERAALSRPPLTRRGRRSAGGSCRLLRCRDGWIALNLARPEDEALLPAWLESPRAAGEPAWSAVARCVAGRRRASLIARGRMMGLAISPADLQPEHPPERWQRSLRLAPIARGTPGYSRSGSPLVVDLSSLWAGPLCAQLLAACGARVVKVESLERPDGARRGESDFFSLLNGWKASVALPFSDPEGRARLAALVEQADIVVEASRPRALAQLGLDAEAIVAQRGSTWVSITGHGRDAPHGDWVAFGDDAAAAGGLLARDVNGDPCFCGDAVADPLTGLHAALAAWSSWAHGGGRMVELSLAQVAGWVRTRPRPTEAPDPAPLPRPPRARRSARPAPALGADTDRILGQLEC